MEAVQTSPSERERERGRAAISPTVCQHGSSRAARKVGHERPADRDEQPISPHSQAQAGAGLATVPCVFLHSTVPARNKSQPAGLFHLHPRTSAWWENMFANLGGKKPNEQSVKLDCVDRLDPTLPHKRARKSKGICNLL